MTGPYAGPGLPSFQRSNASSAALIVRAGGLMPSPSHSSRRAFASSMASRQGQHTNPIPSGPVFVQRHGRAFTMPSLLGGYGMLPLALETFSDPPLALSGAVAGPPF